MNNKVLLLCYYGAPSLADRAETLANIDMILSLYNGPLLIIGDFNQVENQSQKQGGSLSIRGCRMFNDWLVKNELIPVSSHGVHFTWSINRKGDGLIEETQGLLHT